VSKKKETIHKNQIYSFYVGTYTDGEGQGIYKYLLDKDGKLKPIGLAASSENPSYLAMSDKKRFLITVNETSVEGTGTVESYRIEGDSLAFINRSPSGGGHPCFVAVNESGYILAANYSGGNVGLLRINENGKLTGLLDVQQHAGSGISNRQEGPHAHSTWFEGDDDIISVDLGTNELWFSHLDTKREKLLPSNPPKLGMEPGAGPRHLAIHPNGHWMYVLNELDCTVTFVQKSTEGNYKKGVSISTLPAGYSETNYCADIHISSDGNFVYATNRGHNSIVIYEINNQNGSLKMLGHESTRGDFPRNFALSPDGNFLIVANQYTNNIVSFSRNKTTGMLEYIHQVEAPSPVCILF